MCNFAVGKHFTEMCIVPSQEWSKNFWFNCYWSQWNFSTSYICFCQHIIYSSLILLVTSDELVMTCPVVGFSFFFDSCRVSKTFSLKNPMIPMTLPSIFSMIPHDLNFPWLPTYIYLCSIILKHTLIYNEKLLTKLWNILLNGN